MTRLYITEYFTCSSCCFALLCRVGRWFFLGFRSGGIRLRLSGDRDLCWGGGGAET